MSTKLQTQYAIGTQNVHEQARTILNHYKVSEIDLFRLFSAIESTCSDNGIDVVIVDLSQNPEDDGSDHAETCTSDGQTIYLHNQLKDHGWILTRIYDIMHMGCGHLIQWWAQADSGLTWYGDTAFEIGSVFHDGANEDTLMRVKAYELEAGVLGLSYIDSILDTLELTESTKQDIMQLYNDYVITDNKYIIDYYRTWVSTNFFSNWIYDQDMLTLLDLDTIQHINAAKRTTIEIGLVRSDI